MSDDPAAPEAQGPHARIAAMVDEALGADTPPAMRADGPQDLGGGLIEDDGDRPSDMGLDGVDMDVVAGCVALDASDTDNAERFIRHFGADYCVIAAAGVSGGDRVVWTGTHWDVPNGPALAQTLASRLGGRIALEAGFLGHTPGEARAIKAAEGLCEDPDAEGLSRPQKNLVKRMLKAKEALGKRVARRLNHAVTSKNAGRVESMFAFADARARQPHTAFNADRMRLACPNATLRFARIEDEESDPADPRFRSMALATMGHERADRLTAFIPTPWEGILAPAPKWRGFIAEMLPDADKRRTVQMFAGLGLTGVPLQYLMFHYGHGANGKSVFLEVLFRVIGDQLGVGLPRESIIGQGDRGAGSASPDIIRLLFKRFVRILEVKGDAPLQDDLVKRLTGGEGITARALFKGYIEFQNTAKAHMSGNKKPSLDGSDYGTVRRLLLVHWDQTIPEERRREFEEIVTEFVREEGPGILAWLAEGVLDWLDNGERLFIAESVRAATQAYAEANDPVGEFLRMCIRPAIGRRVGASELYEAYQNWSHANARAPRSQKKMGDIASERFDKTEIQGRNYYLDIELHSVPAPPEDGPRNPYRTQKDGR
jgi:putative DNA primase/helicase